MQFHSVPDTQLHLFEAFLAQPMPVPLETPMIAPLQPVLQEPAPEVFSEVSLRGAAGNCLSLLAPMLRELSLGPNARWLTLVAPPPSLTQNWLREAGLNRDRILLLQPSGNQSTLQLAREVLRLGRSHTVVSWFNPLSPAARQQLTAAARLGDAQSLNIRLG